MKAGSNEKREITALREDLSKRTKELDEIKEKYDKLEKTKKSAEDSYKKKETELLKEKEALESKTAELETDLNVSSRTWVSLRLKSNSFFISLSLFFQAERKKIERMKNAHEKELRNRETELAALKVKIRSLEHSSGSSTKKVSELKDEYLSKIQSEFGANHSPNLWDSP